MVHRLVRWLVLPAGILAMACSTSDGDDGASTQAAAISQSCREEIDLLCAEGQFDGCDVPGLTKGHVCVANADREGARACTEGETRTCGPGLKDACTLDPAPSDRHLCVASKEPDVCCDAATKPAGGIEGAYCCADGTWKHDIGNGSACERSGGRGHVCAP